MWTERVKTTKKGAIWKMRCVCNLEIKPKRYRKHNIFLLNFSCFTQVFFIVIILEFSSAKI